MFNCNNLKDNNLKGYNKSDNNLKDRNKDNDNLKCKYCGSDRINNSGKVNNGNQRYLCRDCRRTFTITKRKYSEEYKLKIIKMYLENMGIRSIERLENIPNTTILKWIKNFGKIVKAKFQEQINNIPDNLEDIKQNIEILEGDEIATYIKKNTKTEDKKSGYGFLLIENKDKPMGACSQSVACRLSAVCRSEAKETGIKLLIFK